MEISKDKILKLISDKKSTLMWLMEAADRNFKQYEGCNKLRESISRKEEPNHSQANLIRCLEVSLSVSAKNSQDLMELSQLLLIYIQSDSFSSDVAKMANKMGFGNEALRAMMDAKLKGQ